jgi:predicted O-methyltransferase YrrM
MSILRTARQVKHSSQAAVLLMLLRRRLGSLERTLRRGRLPDQRSIERLVRSWHNEAWSADSALLAALLTWLPKSTGPILECGSGLSTLVLAAAASVANRDLWTLEHDPRWAARVSRELQPHLSSCATVLLAPLRDYGSYEWYAPDLAALPTSIGFVLCDGPPGDTRGGRYGLVPELRNRMRSGCIVILDDTQRPEEHSIVRRWIRELPASILTEAATYTVLQLD